MSSGLDTTASRPFDRPGDEPFQHPTGNIRAHGLAQYSPKSAEAFSIPVPATATKHDTSPLFQIPQPPLAPICPQRWPGIDAESTKMLLKVLEDNHCRWHIFFNYKGFHKCASRLPCVYNPSSLTRSVLKPFVPSPRRDLGDGRERGYHYVRL